MTSWHNTLATSGAVFAADDATQIIHFGDTEAERIAITQDPCVADLSHTGLIKVTGTDAAHFLQGQLTNDIKAVTTTSSQLSGYCDNKGRLLAIFEIFMIGEAYYLQCSADRVDSLIKRLQMFALRADVVFTPAHDALYRIATILNDEQSSPLSSLTLPEKVGDVCTEDQISIIRLLDSHDKPRYQFCGDEAAITALWQSLNKDARAIGYPAWQLLDIEAGLPCVSESSAGQFIPQMVNLDWLGAINFKKGCYVGQEIVARLHYRGTVKRRMVLADIASDQCLPSGSELYTSADVDKEAVGHLVSCQVNAKGHLSALVVIKTKYLDVNGINGVDHTDQSNTLHLGSHDGPHLKTSPLPYHVNDDIVTG